MRKVHWRACGRLDACQQGVLRTVIGCNAAEYFREGLSKLILYSLERVHDSLRGFVWQAQHTQLLGLPLHHREQHLVFVGLLTDHFVNLPVAKYLSGINRFWAFLSAPAQYSLVLPGFFGFLRRGIQQSDSGRREQPHS